MYGSRTELERYMAHFGVDEESACLLMMAGIPLPPRGTAGMPQFQVGVAVNLGQDPTFDAGSIHTVTITITNLTPVDWTIDVCFNTGGLGDGWTTACNQLWSGVSLPAGGSVNVSAAIYMNAVEGTYPTTARVTEKVTGTDQYLDFTFEDVTLILPAFGASALVSWA